MSHRWDWDFEPEQSAQRSGVPEPPATAPEPQTTAGEPRTMAFEPQTMAPEPPKVPAGPRAPVGRSWRGMGLLLAGVSLVVVAGLSASHRHASRPLAAGVAGGGHLDAANLAGSGEAELRQREAPDNVLSYTPFVRQGGDRARDIALTFDDGPGPYTPGVLDVLERFHARATFFAIGEMERYFGSSTVRELRDGDVVGDHTETHPEMARLSAHKQDDQLLDQIARIELLGGQRPTLFRPPFGSFDATTMRELHSLHLLMILWSVDTGDYLRPGSAQIVRRALAGAHPGAIVLLHDAGGDRSETIAALPSIIGKLRARGFHLVTVPQLLADDPPAPGQPLPASLSGD